LSKSIPKIVIGKARMNAALHPFAMNPLKSFPVSLIITNNLMKKDDFAFSIFLLIQKKPFYFQLLFINQSFSGLNVPGLTNVRMCKFTVIALYNWFYHIGLLLYL